MDARQYYSNDSKYGVRKSVALTLDLPISEVEMRHDGQGYFIVRPEGANPDPAAVAAQAPPPPEPPAPISDVDIAKQYQQAYQAAEGIIFLLMGRVAPTLIQKKYFTEDTVNAEGTKFTKYHREVIQDFKNSGRHPDAGDEMYAAFVGSKETFPWVKDATILTIFTTTIPRNTK